MAHQSQLIENDILKYLHSHQYKTLCRFITCGSVDDGKSTLIGRLLYESHLIYDDQLAALESDSKKDGTQGDAIDFALLVDGLAAEREQGITIDVAYRFFSTEKRKFIVADTPGHEQYTRNMATGASTAHVAILMIDARKGILTQTKRHSTIVSMLGANAFWDYRMTDYSDAHSRLGLGGEYLWKDFELRNNWYMSITNEKDVTIKGTSYKERVVDGWDVELGYRLPNNPQLAFFVRGFNWDYKNTQDNSGLEGSVSWQATPHVGLEAYVSNEISAASTTVNTSLPGTDETFFGLRMNITGNPVTFGKKDYKKNMITQMTQPVKREYNVLLERYASNSTFTNRAKGT